MRKASDSASCREMVTRQLATKLTSSSDELRIFQLQQLALHIFRTAGFISGCEKLDSYGFKALLRTYFLRQLVNDQ